MSAQPFEQHADLASWMERLANTSIPGWSMADWQQFTDAVNAAVTPPASTSSPEEAGPWEAVGTRVQQYEIRDGEKLWGLYIADCSMLDEGESNARLIAAALNARGFECAARKQSLPEPGDCDWPTCGCDPHADKVITALEEQCLLLSASPVGETVAHALNEWADLGSNALQWLRNIKDDVSTPAEALEEMAENYRRVMDLSRAALATPPAASDSAAIGSAGASLPAMKAAVELEIMNAIGAVTTRAIGEIVQKAIDAAHPARGPDREAIARAINPQAFDASYWMKGRMHEQKHALERADAILALLNAEAK